MLDSETYELNCVADDVAEVKVLVKAVEVLAAKVKPFAAEFNVTIFEPCLDHF